MPIPGWIDGYRVQVICPSGNADQYAALQLVIAALRRQRLVKASGGFTYSSGNPPLFVGEFRDEGKWQEDRNVLIFIDIPKTSLTLLCGPLARLRGRASEFFAAVGQAQKTFWVTASRISIFQDS